MTDHNRIIERLCSSIVGTIVASVVFALCLAGSPGHCYAQAQDSGLPKGWRPPPPTPKELSIENPLIQQEEVDEWRKKERLAFQEALASGKLTPQNQQVIKRGFRVSVHEMSITDKRNELTDIRKSILRYINQGIDKKYSDVKNFACKSITEHAKQLLDGNFHVRCQAVLLIGELNIEPEIPGLKPKPAVAYIMGLPVLLDVIHPLQGGIQQPEPVRILAALGARRLLELGRHTLKITSKMPVDAARRMLAQLERQGSDWYHQRLIEALVQTALATVPDTQNRQEPVIVEALARILANPRRSYGLRSRAAYLLGRTPMPPGIQSAPIAYSLVKLTQQIATDLNQRKIQSDHALFYLNDIYLAFKAEKGESTTDGRKQAGLVSTLNQQPIQAAYKDILPIVQSIFRQYQGAAAGKKVQATIVAGLVNKLNAWDKPQSMSLSPGRPDIQIPMMKPSPQTKGAGQPRAARPQNRTSNAG